MVWASWRAKLPKSWWTVGTTSGKFRKQGEPNIGPMGKIRRGGYIIKWFIGDHAPRHVHVETSAGRLIGRFNLENMTGMAGWQPERKLLQIILELQQEGRL